MRALDEHRAAALALAAPLPAVEVGLADALGMVLAEDVRADEPLPRWDNSAMDGYAVRRADVLTVPAVLRVVADLPAGSPDEPALEPGTAARIMTGAPVPPGADAVVPIEVTDAGTTTVEIRVAPEPAAHIRRAGEDAIPGDLVLAAGALLGPAHVAALASTCRSSALVHRRPRIAVVSTGDELVPPGTDLRRGQLPDSNSWLLAAAVTEAGAVAVRLGPVSDDPAALLELLHSLDADPSVDGVVTSGGVSMGAFDVVKAALADSPGVEFLPVAVQPGKPQGLGRLPGGTPIWTLPGNPVSSFASFEMFVRPALGRMRGLAAVERPTVTALADEGWRTPPGRAQLMPVRFVGDARVVPATGRGSGSHLVARLALAEGLAVVPAEVDEVVVGASVHVLKVT
ncbi:molybdopterin molybdotransferase MoeA [Cellulomonas rhizosphaerae]|uniref:Molybdopterin molybdenumtransferase n=1 Tax=Cellulomonas rhizosphaerae TaxID=2293719 RepID=A0A413RH45_9CELL|nr:gephyrin-like molybdotransferase Glp [Cellulomonas rhizosphaerae]RHA37117.1 molybdopterin molybdenumtransferase MoeA [Cellulomonas rhizosphaerae]